MTYLPDLAGPGPVKDVGYLSFWHSYQKGEVSRLFFERLVALVLDKPLLQAVGYHSCDLGWCGIKIMLSTRLHLLRNDPLVSVRHPICKYRESDARTQVAGRGGRL